MKDVTTVDTSPAETSGFGEVGTYTIQADANMFRILIDGLYSDKPRAIVRELCTNARDSHADAGILDRPFLLQLPTRFDDTFRVRDYGISLTHEGVMRLYTTVGKSTKRDSNTSVGKFGLGSKVPFAYTDSFTITAVLDGEKRIYNAFMDTGTPKIALLIREPTDEEQGLEVSFPVRRDDHHAFEQAARRVLLGFDVVPINNANIDKPEFKVLFEGADWKVFSPTGYLSGAYVRQGCVLYPVDLNALRSAKVSKATEALARECIILDMPIGSVDITPSRESLSYDSTTAANLTAKFESILDDVSLRMMLQIESAKSYHAAMKTRKELLQSISGSALRDHINTLTFWRGRQVYDMIKVSTNRMEVLKKHGVNWRSIRRDGGRRSRKWGTSAIHYESVDPGKKVRFFYTPPNEPLRYLPLRLTAAVNGRSDQWILMNFTPGSKAEAYLRVALGRPEEIEFVNLLDIPFVKPDYERTAAYYTVFNADREKFLAEGFDDDSDIFYTHTKSGVAQNNGSDVPNTRVAQIWKALKASKLIADDAVLVGIPASRKDLAKDLDDDWDSFFEAAEELVRSTFNPTLAARAKLSHELLTHTRLNIRMDVIDRVTLSGSIQDAGSVALKVADVVRPYLDKNETNGIHIALEAVIPTMFSDEEAKALLALPVDVDLWRKEFSKAMALFEATYPLLRILVSECGYGISDYEKTTTSAMVGYVNMVDRAQQEKSLGDAFCC